MAWLPADTDVKNIHEELTRLFEEEDDPISPAGIKSQSLLESACSRPHTGIGSHDKYSSLEEKAAALFHSLTKNHAFHNGNKRTALVTTLTVLHRNDRVLDKTVTDDILYDFVVAVTADEFPRQDHGLDVDTVVSHVAHWIKVRSEPITTKISDMKTAEFIKKCSQAGANIKTAKKGGSFVITRNQKSIRISQSTRQISGNSIRTYLRNLGINESASGVTVGEFQEGLYDERAQIRRYMISLRRLAKT